MENNNNTSAKKEVSSLAHDIVAILIEHKGLDVRLYNVTGESSITDFYINTTGRSSTQVEALAYLVSDKLEEKGIKALRMEGREGRSWILVDYGDVILNVFDRPSREFYNFDRHLPQGSEVDISDIILEVDKKLQINNAEEN